MIQIQYIHMNFETGGLEWSLLFLCGLCAIYLFVHVCNKDGCSSVLIAITVRTE